MARMKEPAYSPGRKRRRWWVPNLRKGFSPDLLDGIWRSVTNAAAEMERAIISTIKREALRVVPDRSKFRSLLTRVVNFGLGRIIRRTKDVVKDAEKVGKKTARDVIERHPNLPKPKAPRNVDLGTTVRTPKQLQDSFRETAPTLMGSGSALFDEIVRAIAEEPPESDAARRRTAQKILDQFDERGVTGFVDKAGKRWNIVSYVEMATRKAAGDLALRAHLNECVAAGIDVLRVTIMPNSHPYCVPFQGRLLSITGRTKRVGVEPVVATVAEAMDAGWRHPGCRHTAVAWFPGEPFTPPDMIDPGDYAASQELRRLERGVRQWKRAEAAAVTPEAQAKARRHVRQWQAEIRGHVARTGVPRNRYREQVKTAL